MQRRVEELYEDGLEKSLERRLSGKERRWIVAEIADEYGKPNTEH